MFVEDIIAGCDDDTGGRLEGRGDALVEQLWLYLESISMRYVSRQATLQSTYLIRDKEEQDIGLCSC